MGDMVVNKMTKNTVEKTFRNLYENIINNNSKDVVKSKWLEFVDALIKKDKVHSNAKNWSLPYFCK